ncbi:hypothetical protein BHE74_00048598, partial [Ensete ventricosum]
MSITSNTLFIFLSVTARGEERGDVAAQFLFFLPTGSSSSFSPCGRCFVSLHEETNEA